MMKPELMNKKILDLSDSELADLGFLGKGADPEVIKVVESVKSKPALLGYTTCYMVDYIRRQSGVQGAGDQPIVSPRAEGNTGSGDESENYAIVAPHLVSKYERRFYYRGVSDDPPELVYRSNLEIDPFPTPSPRARFFNIPRKIASGVFNTPLNLVWDQVAPLILASLKKRGIKYSALKTVRFTTIHDENATVGPIVIWIAVPPNTTSPGALRDATPGILRILSEAHITGVVVEWYEGEVRKLAGPSLMSVVDRDHGTFGLNHPFNTGLGIPIARQSDGAEGTLTLLFKEVKTSDGKPSDRVFGLTSKHVVHAATTADYEFDGTNAQHVLLCGDRRLKRAVAEVERSIRHGNSDVRRFEKDHADLRARVGTPQEEGEALKKVAAKLNQANEDDVDRHTFLAQVKASWEDPNGRRIGRVDCAPKNSATVDECNYTSDWATILVDKTKLGNFKGNTVDLGNKQSATELTSSFWPDGSRDAVDTIPSSLQLPIRRALPRGLVVGPNATDKNGEPVYIVGKYGNATDLTLGRYSGMDAYTCDEFGVESRETAVYNYGGESGYDSAKCWGAFSNYGDSGSLIFSGDGDAVAMLHSGMPRGGGNHVSFGTPIWWVIKQLLVKYPFAEFFGIAHTAE